MPMLNKTNAVLAAIVLSGAAASAQAAVVTFDNVTEFISATGADALLDFSGNSFAGLSDLPDGGWSTTSSSGFTLGGVNMSVASGAHEVGIIPASRYAYYYDRGTGNQLYAENSQAVTFSFAAPTTSFGLDLSGVVERSGTVTISFSNGDTSTATLGDPYTFNGFLTNTAFSSVTVSGLGGEALLIDNVRFKDNPVSPVPEPSSLAMAGTAMAAMFLLRRRRARSLR